MHTVASASPRPDLRKLARAFALLLLLAGMWQFGGGFAIRAKAILAQILVRDAWARTLAGERQAKPWPWADTWPVARLAIPERNIDLFVLAGANGRTIAFGPGHVFGTALPGDEGNSVIGGHRDTHLAFLRDTKPGTEIRVQRPDGPTRITLVTCYPFDALRPGGPQRYIVFADAI